MTIDQILIDVRSLLTEIIGEEYALGLNIGMGTTLDTDLQLESIEFVKLATLLTERYGDRVDFVAFLAGKELDEIIQLTVGELVIHIAGCLTLAGSLDG
jgi:acyl carrier protein